MKIRFALTILPSIMALVIGDAAAANSSVDTTSIRTGAGKGLKTYDPAEAKKNTHGDTTAARSSIDTTSIYGGKQLRHVKDTEKNTYKKKADDAYSIEKLQKENAGLTQHEARACELHKKDKVATIKNEGDGAFDSVYQSTNDIVLAHIVRIDTLKAARYSHPDVEQAIEESLNALEKLTIPAKHKETVDQLLSRRNNRAEPYIPPAPPLPSAGYVPPPPPLPSEGYVPPAPPL
ncbi:hypothetical protein FACS1894126_4080 [Alphaproteobacteria bacterium]|nr:hypothetical protein FACS1894126_4080 [Alphaproteobacteria bacterium]